MAIMGEAQAENPLHSLSDYDFAHLFDHLAAFESVSDVFGILAVSTTQQRNAWFDAKFARNDISGFIRDVQIAWRMAADKPGKEGCKLPAESIAREIQCALMISSINTSLEGLPPQLLPAAVTARVWSSQEAFAVAMQPLEWALRLRCVTALLPILLDQDPSSIDVLFGLLRGRPKGERSRSMVRIGDSREGEDDVPDHADEYLKATVFERIAAILPEGAVERAAKVAETIRVPWSRAAAVASLAPRLQPEVRQAAIERTLAFVREIGKPSLRAECLALLSHQMPLAERSTVLDEAWQLQVGAFTGHPDEQRFALTPRTGVLRVLDGTTWVEEATCGLRRIAAQFDEARLLRAIERSRQLSPQYKELSLMCLAPRLVAFARRDEAVQISENDISSSYLRLIALLEIDRYEEENARLERADSRLKQAEGFENLMIRARAKVLVGNVYPEIFTAGLADEALSACEQIGDDTHYKAVQVRDVVNGLDKIAPEERSQIAARALKICQSITDCEQDVAMKSLMGFLGQDSIKEVILHSFVVDASPASVHLEKIAFPVPNDPVFEGAEAQTPWDDEVISTSVNALNEIVRTANENVDPETLKEYGERGAASRAVRRHGDAEAWARMFASQEENERLTLAGHCAIFLAPRLGPEIALDASKAIAQLRDFYWRSSALIALSDHMVEPAATESITSAMESACRLRQDRLHSELFGRIAQRLTPTRIPAIHQIWNKSLMKLSRDHRSYVVGFLRSSLVLLGSIGSEEAISRIVDVTRIVETWWRPQEGWAKASKSPRMLRNVGTGEAMSTLVGVEGHAELVNETKEIDSALQSSTTVMKASDTAAVLSALASYFVTNKLDKCLKTCKDELFRLVKQNSTNDGVLQPYLEFIASATDAYGKRKDVDGALELYNDWSQNISVAEPRKRLMAATVSFGAVYACCEARAFGPAQEILSRLISLGQEHVEEEELQKAVVIAYNHLHAAFQRFANESRTESTLEIVRRAGPFGPGTGTREKVTDGFREALHRAGMTFILPRGFKMTRVPPDDPLRPLQILTSNKPLVKVYYFVRTAEEGLSPDLNEVFSKTLDRISLGKVGPVACFPEAAVRADFLADRGGTRQLHVNPQFPGSLVDGMGVVLQADGLAEVLVLIMFADFINAQSLMHAAFYSLKFVPAAEAE
jgi:hypothetical protein